MLHPKRLTFRRRTKAIAVLGSLLGGTFLFLAVIISVTSQHSGGYSDNANLQAQFFDFDGGGESPFGSLFGEHPLFGSGGPRGPMAKPKPKGPVDNLGFYKILEVNRDASMAEIKKAYRKMSLKYHPDKQGGDTKKFKELNTAYGVLTDKKQRDAYDKGGMDAVDEHNQMEDSKKALQRQMGGGREKKMPTLTHKLKVTLDDIYNGKTKRIALRRTRVCSDCDGKGTIKEDAEITCMVCRGRGRVMKMRQLGRGLVQQIPAMCDACHGTGSAVAEKDKCTRCRGSGTENERKVLEINIPPGIDDDDKVILKGVADEKPGYRAGDLHVEILAEKHPKFSRFGDYLVYKKKITAREAFCGFTFPIKQLDNRTIWVKSPADKCITPGSRIYIPGEGFPLGGESYKRGDMIVQFDVEFPETLDAATRTKIREILPGPDPEDVPEDENPATMIPFDNSMLQRHKVEREKRREEEKKKEKKKSIWDADDEESDEEQQGQSPFGGGFPMPGGLPMGGGGQSVQCRTQ
mmetsp:Transcript_14432/g.21940  ORF Transcript_14432/g.21940 Transcript_14432/m.21940 type:complete len:520 (+) Transcript_14432:149-1708(+)|eukprot:CAMPEP_0167759660 /NCGR_PEP_ID=MMETSP0110_2-20121227/11144_1 /TAXON_ID=629695 /ORGANISM="Gymnochlora sp., Strain CCMP2014" /LENGTH=519 /DNA_ID=CAMNT_0007646065 /DNA_START=94 /DNA_END=1653 /DNA_ORIENTATION=-